MICVCGFFNNYVPIVRCLVDADAEHKLYISSQIRSYYHPLVSLLIIIVCKNEPFEYRY